MKMPINVDVLTEVLKVYLSEKARVAAVIAGVSARPIQDNQVRQLVTDLTSESHGLHVWTREDVAAMRQFAALYGTIGKALESAFAILVIVKLKTRCKNHEQIPYVLEAAFWEFAQGVQGLPSTVVSEIESACA